VSALALYDCNRLRHWGPLLHFQKGENIFSQGDSADSLFRIHEGSVKLTVVGAGGKEATVAVLAPGSFAGESCLADVERRTATATALIKCSVERIDKAAGIRLLHEDAVFREALLHGLLARNLEYEADLSDQVMNGSEHRLARALLKLCRLAGAERERIAVLSPKPTHEALSQMVGTTRSRVTFFMNKFRRLGFIEYDRALIVHADRISDFLRKDATRPPTVESLPIEDAVLV
jgi:CRP-like cAMP-binding protein